MGDAHDDAQVRPRDAEDETRVGLCASCRHASVQRSARGSHFWRCRRADHEPQFRRYPPLPVVTCRGYERVC